MIKLMNINSTALKLTLRDLIKFTRQGIEKTSSYLKSGLDLCAFKLHQLEHEFNSDDRKPTKRLK